MSKRKKTNEPDAGVRPETEQTVHRAAADQLASEAAAQNAPAQDPSAQDTADIPALDASVEGFDPVAEVDPLEQLRAELKEAKHRELRGLAELENYRKRITREMQEERRYANLPLMRDILPVLDNMARAIEAVDQGGDTDSLLDGVKMVARLLEDVLGKYHCVKIEALNEPFDPHLHEAISQQACDEHPANTVVSVVQTGFQLNNRVVRPSQVIVSTAKE